MSSAPHLASHAAPQTRTFGSGFSAGAGRIWNAVKTQAVRTRAEFSLADALASAGYTVLLAYSVGLIAYIAGLY